ncbi:MAG TPA: alpha/beta family hydrolase [Candidatus Saccharimonadales bacterium]|nr:alpha/beta family hydrolase [Candidatus Saccharimonadales bacterium]
MHLYLGHGAAGSAATMQPWVEALGRRGIPATAVQLPKRRAEDAVAAYAAQVADLAGSVIGGHSYGGRVASFLAAQQPCAGLVLLSYPLHRPGAPHLEVRTSHWPAIRCPVLLLSGESDPFARIDLLREAVRRLPNAELVTWPRLGHGLLPARDDAADRIAGFVRSLRGRGSGDPVVESM